MDDDELRAAAKVLDKLLTCDNENIKNSLRELLVMVTLLQQDKGDGPLTQTLNRLDELEKNMRSLRSEMYHSRHRTAIDEEAKRREYHRRMLDDMKFTPPPQIYSEVTNEKAFKKLWMGEFTQNPCSEIKLPSKKDDE